MLHGLCTLPDNTPQTFLRSTASPLLRLLRGPPLICDLTDPNLRTYTTLRHLFIHTMHVRIALNKASHTSHLVPSAFLYFPSPSSLTYYTFKNHQGNSTVERILLHNYSDVMNGPSITLSSIRLIVSNQVEKIISRPNDNRNTLLTFLH